MNIKQIFQNLLWNENDKYDFNLAETNNNNNNNNNNSNDNYISDNNLNLEKKIYSDVNSNLNFMKMKYNSMINSDIVIREFTLKFYQRDYKAFLIFIDGMIDTNLLNDFILKPLFNIKNKENIVSEQKTFNNVIIKKIKKINLEEDIYNCFLPQSSINKEIYFNNIIYSINSGNCALFIDTIPIAFDIDVKGFKQREVNTPNNEIIIKGPQESFVENIRTNTSLLRRIVNNENLITENIKIGNITKTKCAICYIKTIANDDLVAEVKYRLNNLKIDSLLSSGQLEQLIISDNRIRST